MLVSFVLSFLFAASFVGSNAKAEVVPAKDGVPISYSVQGKGDPTLVFIHCWSCDRHLWDNQVSVFAKEHRVVTIDLPGHGSVGTGTKGLVHRELCRRRQYRHYEDEAYAGDSDRQFDGRT